MAKSEFKEIFGITMHDLSKEFGCCGEYISQIFRGQNTNKKIIERVAIRLNEIADSNYETEISMAKYKRRKAEKIIKQLFEML